MTRSDTASWEGLTPPYRTIVADPPWSIESLMRAGGRRRRATTVGYSFMDDDAIAGLDVAGLAAADAHLWLWVTAQRNRIGVGVRIAEAWGFRVGAEIVWAKPNLGMGQFPRNCHEIVLICHRGPAFDNPPLDVRSVQPWSQTYATNGGKTHSAKPPAFFDLVERVSPGPRVELFARAPRLGWDHWGYGYEAAPEREDAATTRVGPEDAERG